jgi:hypothetical protein
LNRVFSSCGYIGGGTLEERKRREALMVRGGGEVGSEPRVIFILQIYGDGGCFGCILLFVGMDV